MFDGIRADLQPDVEVYAWDIRQALPSISTPLMAPDPDIQLELGAVLDTAYARSRYDRKLRYSGPPQPLSPDDSEWIASVVNRVGD